MIDLFFDQRILTQQWWVIWSLTVTFVPRTPHNQNEHCSRANRDQSEGYHWDECLHLVLITISNVSWLGNAVFSQLTDQAACSNQQRAAYFEQKHPSDCDEESRAAISGRFFQELLMKNGLYMYQVEKELLLNFLWPHFHAWTTTLKTLFEHEREWYNSSFMSRTFLSSSWNSTSHLQQGSVKFQKDKILSNFKESSNVHFKCLMQIYYFHWYFDGRILLM